MGKEYEARNYPHQESDEAEQLRSLLQKVDIAPVDETRFGVQLAQLIRRVRNMSKKRAR